MVNRHAFLLLSLLLMDGCFKQDKGRTSEILPPDYQTSFSTARGCRPIQGHQGSSIAVMTNAAAAAAYSSGSYPLPQGSVIAAVESDRSDCSNVTGFTVMFKEAAGYNPVAGDWHWQRLDDQHDVLDDGRVQSCIGCHASCSSYDYTCSR
jgi:hypothetical protein